MKTKAKLLLAISTLSAVVLAAGVTSTFAWFTTKSTVALKTGNLTVHTLSKLKIFASQVAGESSSSNADKTLVTVTDGLLGSVSSVTGESFYAPTTLGDNTDLTAINDQDAVDALKGAGNKYCDYLKYNIMVMSEKESDGGKALKLNIKVTATGDNITKWYRVAVYGIDPTSSESSDRTKTTDPVIGALTGNRTANSDTWKAVYANSAYEEKPATGVSSFSPSKVTRTALSGGEATITIAPSFTSTEGPAFKDLCVAVWMEGTAEDGTDQNTAGGEKVKVDFTFSV